MNRHYICVSYLAIVVVFIFCSPTRSEMKSDTKGQRSLVVELKNMISELFDKDDVTEAEKMDSKQRNRKSPAEGGLKYYKKTQADNLRREGIDDVTLLPLYPCDEFDEGRRSCSSIRQIGTTLTFGVHVEGGKDKYFVRWFRFFKVLRSESEIKEELTTEKKPWNINFGEDNTELRISPITETDYSDNYFVAFLKNRSGQDKLAGMHYLKFYIQPLAIDMGTLYHGEELFINVRSFIELPVSSVMFEWKQNDVDKANNFPRNTRHVSSNMKKNADGSTLIIKEFMDSDDKILSCYMYSNKNVLIARRDFLLKKIVESDDLQKDLEEEVSHERKRRTLPENYEYASYSDKDAQESDDSYSDDIKVVNMDSPPAKRNIKTTPGRLRQKSPAYNNHPMQYHRRYKIPSPADREHQSVEPPYGKQSLNIRTIDGHGIENFGRHPVNSPRRLNQKSPDYNSNDARYHRRYRLPSAPVYDGQSAISSFYNKKLSPNQPIYIEQQPSGLSYGKKSRSSFAFGGQSSSAYGEQTPSSFSYDGQPDPTMLKSPYLKTLIKQVNSLDHSPNTQKTVELRVVDIESAGVLTFDDIESRLISSCSSDSECGIHAFCYDGVTAQTAVFEPTFCRCKNDYVGNGMFCWLF